MKKSIFNLVLTATFLLSACGGNTVQPTPTAGPVMDASTATPSPLPSPTRTAQPTATPIPATRTVTPLPTIPTFTPTFDARTIVTVTPASPAECPKAQKNVIVNLSSYSNYYPEVVFALNNGATIQTVSKAFKTRFSDYPDLEYETADVTNDGVPEIILPGNQLHPQFAILRCGAGKYINIFSRDYQLKDLEFLVTDANQNGIKEIIIGDIVYSAGGSGFDLSVIEWHMNRFEEILGVTSAQDTSWSDLKVEDINNDKINEIYWIGGVPRLSPIKPWRLETQIYQWYGNKFVPLPVRYESPQYRFQAIQDADQDSNNGEYQKAISGYQDVIFSNNLEWWSRERQEFESKLFNNNFASEKHTPPPLPQPDTTEYPKLAAYAYYRIMLLHTVRGYESDAGTIYNTLQQKFGADPNGRPYAEMATAFWDAYQSTHKMYDGCAAAIQYAAEHPEILIPLGSDYHGDQSHTYVPEDVCPFR